MVQLRLSAGTPTVAVADGLRRHAEAAHWSNTEAWILARLELMTAEEFDREWSTFTADGEAGRVMAVLDGTSTADPVAEAEAALDAVTSAEGAREVLQRLVHGLGGGVVAARMADEWTIPVDLSFGAGEPKVPVAEPWSVARMRLEQALPRLIARAQDRLAEAAAQRRVGTEA